MPHPTVDIVVPVWNSPFETRSCLAAILEHSPDARLVIVDNGSNRETELMLEEFSEPLGERGLFIKSERNLGLVRGINMGLARSDSDCAVIVRPSTVISQGWLEPLLEAATGDRAGMVTPLLSGPGALDPPRPAPGCTLSETFSISFSALLINTEMRMIIGPPDDSLDGGAFCLRDYVRRAAEHGYRTLVTSRSRIYSGSDMEFGSEERRRETARASMAACLERWGAARSYAVYFPRGTDPSTLLEASAAMLECARRGHSFTVLLHRKEAAEFRRMGGHALHTCIELRALSLLFPDRDLTKQIEAIRKINPAAILVRGVDGVSFPGGAPAIPFGDILKGYA